MTSSLVWALLERSGLSDVLAARERGTVPLASPDVLDVLERADLLALGAAADIVRRRECGPETRIYVPQPPAPGDGLSVIGETESLRGTALLRRLATLRLTGPIALSIVVDFGAVGLPIGQLALSFGATDLAGPIASRRGLPVIAEDKKRMIKRREIAGYVERAGFRPVFVSRETPVDTGEAPAPSSRNHAQS